jgi:hypothetical protein
MPAVAYIILAMCLSGKPGSPGTRHTPQIPRQVDIRTQRTPIRNIHQLHACFRAVSRLREGTQRIMYCAVV